MRVVQNLYTGGAVTSRRAIARLIEEKRTLEYQALVNRVSLDVRVAFYDVLLDRAKIRVREQSVGVLEEELKTQRERLSAGLVGALNVSRAEVALANEHPELIDAQTRLENSYLRLSQLIGVDPRSSVAPLRFEAAGQLQYHSRHPDLNECLAYADVSRPEIRAREIDVEIENQQLILDRSETRPRVEAFTGYEVYSESDPLVGPEFNHGYIVGLNATWHIFDGFATRGRMQATRARRDAALHALEAARRSVAADVRSAFLDLQQADRVLQSETRNVQNADESLEIAKGNLGAGLGTQLDILQAASDVTRTRTTRLGAFYLHNVALARLARASAREPDALGFAGKAPGPSTGKPIAEVAAPPSTSGRLEMKRRMALFCSRRPVRRRGITRISRVLRHRQITRVPGASHSEAATESGSARRHPDYLRRAGQRHQPRRRPRHNAREESGHPARRRSRSNRPRAAASFCDQSAFPT